MSFATPGETAGPPPSARELEERVEKLERIFEADAERFIPDAEVRRQERWHATYNAVLPECHGQLHGIGDDELRSDRAHAMAVYAADRAHRPLDGKVTPRPDINVAGVTVGNVNALVAAARRMNCGFQGHQTFDPCRCASCEVFRALKPFEAP